MFEIIFRYAWILLPAGVWIIFTVAAIRDVINWYIEDKTEYEYCPPEPSGVLCIVWIILHIFAIFVMSLCYWLRTR